MGIENIAVFQEIGRMMRFSGPWVGHIDDYFLQGISPLSHLAGAKEQHKVWIIKEQ